LAQHALGWLGVPESRYLESPAWDIGIAGVVASWRKCSTPRWRFKALRAWSLTVAVPQPWTSRSWESTNGPASRKR